LRVILVDDQILFAESLKNILEMRTEDIRVVGLAYNGQQAIELVKRKRVDVVLMDVRMPVLDGVEATRRILLDHPETRVIMLTTFDDDEYVHEALQYGAVGYLLKTIPPAELITSIRAVKHGTIQISPSVAKKLLDSFRPNPENRGPEWLKGLSAREREVLKLLSKGLSNRQIAERLFIAEQTVKNHLSVIYSKMDVHHRTEAILKAKEHGVSLQ